MEDSGRIYDAEMQNLGNKSIETLQSVEEITDFCGYPLELVKKIEDELKKSG